MNRSGVVYLAAINGPALDGGHEIETLGSLIPGGGGTQRRARMLGTAKALEEGALMLDR